MTMLQLLQRLTQPPKQTLRTVQPTPSTVLYSVSTRPIPKTIVALLVYYASILSKFVVGLSAIGAALLKWKLSLNKDLGLYFDVPGEDWTTQLLKDASWKYLLSGVIAILWLVLRRGHTEESLLVLQGLGLQTSTSSPTYLHSATQRFIPTTSIQDIFIHEAFKGFEVRFYLAIVVKGEEDVVVVFPSLLPRRAILEEVWRGSRACLYESGRKEKENTP